MAQARVEAEAWYDLLILAGYLADVAKNRRAAHALGEEFDRKCEIYSRQPAMGDLMDGFGGRYRSFTFRRWYVAIYEPLADGIRVLRVFDGRSDYTRRFAP